MSPHGAHKTPPRDLRRALTTPAAHPTPTTPTSTSTSLRDRFPTLTPAQHARLDRIISALPADARTWAEFKGKQEELERGEGPARRTSRAPVTEDNDDDDDDDEADDDADIFQASLQLVFQDGATWKDKWRGVQARIAQATGEGPARRLSGTGRTGDRLGIVRARMDQVQLEDDGRPSSSRRPGLQATPSSATRISPPRPHSTPVDLAASPMKGRRSNSTTRGPTHESTRSFLVRRPEPGYSSSDDYAGVPSLQDLVLARRRRRDQEQSEQPNQTTSPEEVRHDRTSKRRSTTAQPPVHHCADDTSPGSAIIPIESTPARPSKHPLLERRLAELGLDSPISRHLEDAELATPEPAIRRTSTRRDETSHALTATSGRGSAPSIRNAQALEAEADRFRRLRLISTHYDAWQSLLSFQTSRARSVKHARDTWLVRCALRQWASTNERFRSLRDREIVWDQKRWERQAREGARLKAGAWDRWREAFWRRQEARREEEARERREAREVELKRARSEVFKRRNEELLRRSLDKWRIATLDSLALRFRLRYLPLRPLRAWQRALALKRAHVETLESVAEEIASGIERRRMQGRLDWWRKRTRIQTAERFTVQRLTEATMRGALVAWVNRTREAIHLRQLDNTATVHRARQLASSALAAWKHRHRQIVNLEQRSLDFRSTSTVRLVRTTLKTWSLSSVASRHYESQTATLAKSLLSTWVEKLDHLEIELEGRALSIAEVKNVQLQTVTFEAWLAATRHRKKLQAAAQAVSDQKSLSHALSKWKTRVKEVRLDGRKADVVRDFFVERSAWRTWVERVAQRKRDRWLAERVRLRKKEAFGLWTARTRRSIDDKNLLSIVQQKTRKRILRERLETWKEQVIVRKELERESTILYESQLVQALYKRWVFRTVDVANSLARADNFRSIKAEELRDSTFHRWLSSTRRSMTLKQRLSTHAEQRRRSDLENAFGRWRERKLETPEKELEARLASKLRKRAFEKWSASTTTLTALQTYRRHRLRRTLDTWKRWTPSIDTKQRAVMHDSSTLISAVFERWSLKTSYRRAFRHTSGRLSTPHSLRSPSPRPSPVSVADAAPSSASLSLPLRDTFDSSVLSLDSPTRGSLAPSQTQSISTDPTTLPSVSMQDAYRSPKRFAASPSSSPSFFPSHRPRLSAEYVAPPRPSPRRRGSFASVGARSAPAPIESDDGDEDSGAFVAAMPSSRSDGNPHGKRDVRKGFEALRERLRAAAISTSGSR